MVIVKKFLVIANSEQEHDFHKFAIKEISNQLNLIRNTGGDRGKL